MKSENEMTNAEYRCILEGIISVKAAVEAKKRKIYSVWIDKRKKTERDRKVTAFISFLKANDMPFELKDREEIESTLELFSKNAGSSHGGVIAFAGAREYTPVSEMLKKAGKNTYFAYFDGIEDPYNLGYAVRTMYALGAGGFILSERNWQNADGLLVKSSAGACEFCDIAFAPKDDEKTVEIIKNSGLDIVCSAVSKDAVSVYDFKAEKPFVLFIGGEKRGISEEFMKNADKIVYIPYKDKKIKYSLPTVSACSVYAAVFAKELKLI